MSEFDLQEFRREVPVGSRIRILSKAGREHTGKLVDVSADRLRLEREDGSPIVIPFNWLLDWVLLVREGNGSTGASATPAPKPPPRRRRPAGPARAFAGFRRLRFQAEAAPDGPAVPRPEVAERKESARGSEVDGIASQFTGAAADLLRAFPPDFTMPEGLAYARKVPVSRALSDLKNKWEFAQRAHEPYRLKDRIADLQRLEMENADLGTFAYDLGCFHLELAQYAEAAVAFTRVPRQGPYAQACHNLAIAALRLDRKQLAWAGLQQFFSLKVPADHLEAWRTWTWLAVETGMLGRAAALLVSQLDRAKPEAHPIVLDSGIHLLAGGSRSSQANQLAALRRDPARVHEELRAALAVLLHANAAFTDATAADVLRGPSTPPPPRHVLTEPARPAGSTPAAARTPAPAPAPATPSKSRRTPLLQKAADAEMQKDFDEAERLYRKAVRTRDGNWEAAAKNLAMLLQRLKRHEDGIKLLEAEMPRFTNPRPAKQILRHLYAGIG
ncbi:MAG TPA: hypothetical protein VFR37_05770, partial [Longimicrobium sp.]|nr:hypothetical protein [Longimicrobium sp.]